MTAGATGPAGASRPSPVGKQLLVSVLGGGTKTLSGAGKELSTQMTGTADHRRTSVDEKTFTAPYKKRKHYVRSS